MLKCKYICPIIFAIVVGLLMKRMDVLISLEEVGRDKCLHMIENIDGPEDMAKFGNILIISSNNYKEALLAHKKEDRMNSKGGSIYMLLPPFDTNKQPIKLELRDFPENIRFSPHGISLF